MQNPIDSTLPPTFTDSELHDTAGFLANILATLLEPDSAPLLNTGTALWRGLSVIVVTWTGLRIAYSGTMWSAGEFLRMFMTLLIPWLMLQFYATPLEFGGLTAPPFPLVIPAGGDWLAQRFQGDTVAHMQAAFMNMFSAMGDRLTTMWNSTSISSLIFLGSNAVFNFLVSLAFLPVFGVTLLLVFAVGYCQVVYATLAIAIFIFLGPVMIPFLVFEPLSFLFWSWLKGLFTFSLYTVIANILLHIWSAIGLTFIATLIQASALTGEVAFSDYAHWFVAILVFTIAALYSTMQIGTLAGMLTGGGGGGGMGGALMGGAAMLASGGKSALLKGVGK